MKSLADPAFLLPLVLLGLLSGISGGFIRVGSTLTDFGAAAHGLYMVGGFLGTLISIERAMVMKQKAWLLVPFTSGISTLFFLLDLTEIGYGLLLLASSGLVIIMHLQSLKHPKIHTFLLYGGAVLWFLGNFMAYEQGLIAAGATWWIGFLLFTIVGERLELSEFLPVKNSIKNLLLAFLAMFLLGLIFPFHGSGPYFMGSSALLIAGWLLCYDMAKLSVKKENQFKYIGLGLLVGYVWLLIFGLTILLLSSHPLYYDLLLHSFFLGFVFSMIWAHAPIIFPLIFGFKESPFHSILWIPWAIFQVSLIGRFLSSWMFRIDERRGFAVVNGFSILVIFMTMAAIVLWKKRFDKKTKTSQSDIAHNRQKKVGLNFEINA
ncbi:hypothetical protein [Algoriphagus hitonicola]|uniref:Uncharacterized protein n=1 Tax=Algoriphagus hitonicola TaxID=435880 RepID=A0A1I2VLW7_9BACT|nr:hypothetical protein [Algoriphagus hitonicola]SFG90324.1 hypothetical protein SAMN04487988_11028 [Algoriphagus hitonicola]